MCLRHAYAVAHAAPSIYEMQTKVNLDPAFILQAIYFYSAQPEPLRRPSQPFIEALQNVICAWIILFYFCYIQPSFFILFTNKFALSRIH